jgi:hypothetical protein
MILAELAASSASLLLGRRVPILAATLKLPVIILRARAANEAVAHFNATVALDFFALNLLLGLFFFELALATLPPAGAAFATRLGPASFFVAER